MRQPEGATSQPWRECRAERVGQPGESAAQPSRGGGAERVGQPAEVRQPTGVGQPSEAAAPSPRGRLGGHQVGPSGWSNQQDWPLSPRGESGPSGWGDHQELPPNPRGEAGPIGWGNLQERPPSPHWETWPSEGANQSGLPRRTRGQTGPSLGGEPPPWLAGPVTAPSTANGRLRSGSGVGAAPRDGPETRVAGPKNVGSPPRPSSSSLPATGALSTIVAQPAAADPQPGVGSPALPAAAAAREHLPLGPRSGEHQRVRHASHSLLRRKSGDHGRGAGAPFYASVGDDSGSVGSSASGGGLTAPPLSVRGGGASRGGPAGRGTTSGGGGRRPPTGGPADPNGDDDGLTDGEGHSEGEAAAAAPGARTRRCAGRGARGGARGGGRG